MSLITEHLDPDISESRSRFKKFFGIPVIGNDGNLLDGEKTFPDGTLVRFQNGLIDGNIYDSRGEVLYTYPAVEYADSPGKEYWTKGLPQGYPAICQDAGLYEEYWSDGKIDKTVETFHNYEICYEDDEEYEYDEEDECYYCSVNMDEDDMARFIQSSYKNCPYYKSGDEYRVVRHQM